jgi:hypothetical protein
MKLVCIDDVTDVLNGEKHLTWGKEYEIVSFYQKDSRGRQFVSIINDRGKVYDYLLDRFVSKAAFRELQLKKLEII